MPDTEEGSQDHELPKQDHDAEFPGASADELFTSFLMHCTRLASLHKNV